MRILTGAYKGRAVNMPAGIRPTQNKVRKAVFDILGDIRGLSFLELFAGSGAVGFEAASRGASEVVLVEENRSCLKAIERTREALGLKGCTVIPLAAQAALEALKRRGKSFDLVFLDPPYGKGLAKKTLQMLGGCDIVAPNSFVIIQHFRRDDLPESSGGLILFKQAGYGDTLLSFYRKE